MTKFDCRVASRHAENRAGLDDKRHRAAGRFLTNTVLDSAAAPITLIRPWNPDAKK